MPLRAPEDRAPTPFGPYLLDSLLAEGGMARVYRARLRGALGFEKPLVVKQVRPELARDPRFVAMFAKEAKALVRLVHPHIVPVYELGVVDGVYFIAMEHIAGATLEGVLAEGPLEAGAVAHVGLQVAEALQHAHERHDLVHRDVTPRNVMVDDGGHARLLDFGIATPTEGGDAEVFGTPGYLSPEQARGGEVGPASDVFSLGCVLVRALTGEGPFDGAEGKTRLLAGERPALGGVPDELAVLLQEALAGDPAARPAARQVARRLRAWLAGTHPEGVGAALADRVQRAVEHAPAVQTTGESTAAVGKVEALATSQVLADARPSTPVTPRVPRGEATAPIAGRAAEATAPISGRGGPAAGEGTAPIPGRGPRSAEAAERADASERVPPSAPADAAGADGGPTLGRGRLLAALVAALLVAGLGWRMATREVPAPPDPAPARAPEPAGEPEVAVEVPPAVPAEPVEAPSEASDPPSEPPPEPAPVARGVLRITASPWAQVAIDGRSAGSTPLRGIRVSPGTHRVRLECPPLGAVVERILEVGPGAEVVLDGALDADPPRLVVR